MHARTPTFRTPAAPAVTLRHRMALAMARRFGPQHLAHPPSEQRAAERFERLDLDQRVRETGEW